MDVGKKEPTSSPSSHEDGVKKPASGDEGTEEARTTHSVGGRGESLDSTGFDGDEYDDYDDFNLTKSSGGGGGGGKNRAQKQKEKGSANIYSSKHTRLREARKGQQGN
mmetsp:Transcript_16391/g.47077  ORF Transcript_16391/g.47077 Transcript_16391/m.47077 type:complete len:108 (+) Transcript_16391:162-485(+)